MLVHSQRQMSCRYLKASVSLYFYNLQEYLEQYGYLKKHSTDEGNIQHSEEDRKHAIRLDDINLFFGMD